MAAAAAAGGGSGSSGIKPAQLARTGEAEGLDPCHSTVLAHLSCTQLAFLQSAHVHDQTAPESVLIVCAALPCMLDAYTVST
jgi:hypothetical protein